MCNACLLSSLFKSMHSIMSQLIKEILVIDNIWDTLVSWDYVDRIVDSFTFRYGIDTYFEIDGFVLWNNYSHLSII